MTSSHEWIFYILNQSVIPSTCYAARMSCPNFPSFQNLLGTCIRVFSHADMFRNVALASAGWKCICSDVFINIQGNNIGTG